MIVSHEHKFIFIKTKKTAGTSIEVLLSKIAGDDAIVTPVGPPEPGHVPRNYQTGPIFNPLSMAVADPRGWRPLLRHPSGQLRQYRQYWNHMPAALIRAKLGEKMWDTYFKFCFERNPWDKVISLYWWRFRDKATRPSLDEFISSSDAWLGSNWHLYTIDGQIAVDAVGRYEHLGEDLHSFLRQLDLPVDLDLPRAKSSSRLDVEPELLSPHSVEQIRHVFRREIRAFGYECPRELIDTHPRP